MTNVEVEAPYCHACDNTGTSYWSDGVYGSCMDCNRGEKEEEWDLEAAVESTQQNELDIAELNCKVDKLKDLVGLLLRKLDKLEKDVKTIK